MTPQDSSAHGGSPLQASRPTGPVSHSAGAVPPIVRSPVPAVLGGDPLDPHASGAYPPPHDIYAPRDADPYAPRKPAGEGSSRSAVPVVLALTAVFGGVVVLFGCGGLMLLATVTGKSSSRQYQQARSPRPPSAYPQRTYEAPPPVTYTPPPSITYTPPKFRPYPTTEGVGADGFDKGQQMLEEMQSEQQRMIDEQRRRVEEQMELSRQRHQQFLEQIKTGPSVPRPRSGRISPPSIPRVPTPPTAPRPPAP